MLIILEIYKNYEKAEQIYGDAVETTIDDRRYQSTTVRLDITYYKTYLERHEDIVNIDSSLMAMQLMLTAKAHGYDTNLLAASIKKILRILSVMILTDICQI